MSEAKTTLVKLGLGAYKELTWVDLFPNLKWSDVVAWSSSVQIPIAVEYVVETEEETEVEFPFVVRTTAPVKKVFIGAVEYPVRKLNYGTRFQVPQGRHSFYYADKYKLPDVVLRKHVFVSIHASGVINISGNATLNAGAIAGTGSIAVAGDVVNPCSLTDWGKFADGWTSCDTWT